MEDSEDDAKYPPNPYISNYHQSFGSSHRPKLPVRNASYAAGDDEEEEEEEGEEEEEEEEENGEQRSLEEADDNEEDRDDVEGDGEDSDRTRKRRKLRSSGMAYEFAPRIAAPSAVAANALRASFGSRSGPTDWTEHSTFVLVDAWGDRFLQHGRKSLRSDEWIEVAKKVSQASKTVRTDTQCRNRLDTLKKKYKREKIKLEQTGSNTSKWVYFKKMDMLMSPAPQQPGLPCGLDSGEYVFMNPNVYLNRSNELDEMRDSPGNSESLEGDEDDSDGLPPKKGRFREGCDEGSSFRLLADSIQKFGEIYEKIENNKRQQMLELEKMRIEFHRDLELQKKQILEHAQAEIEKLQHDDDGHDDDDDDEIEISAENTSE